jgi:predicted helicase
LKKVTEQIHKVQILDPAVGTGTFLNEVIHEIHKSFAGQEGQWSAYAKESLLPRLHGFELMMASYTMAHLKLGVTLKELGYEGDDRISVWLTNSLEEAGDTIQRLPLPGLMGGLTEESRLASKVKLEMPIMVVLGNPPYSGVSSNNTEIANSLVYKYKIEPGGKKKLQERKQWLNDDYVKFISFAEDQIQKNGEGVVAFVTNHGYIDNPTFRGMRWHLLKTFDEIYVLDLHGNAKKKERALDGGKDENVFDIMQGVSIIFAIKKHDSNINLATLYHADLYGKRKDKNEELDNLDFETMEWKKVDYQEPYYFFVKKDYKAHEEYKGFFNVHSFFNVDSVGFISANDGLNISFTEKEQAQKIKDLTGFDEITWRIKYSRSKDSRDWQYLFAQKDAANSKDLAISQVSYRPFDTRYTLYTGNSRGLYSSPQPKVMKHLEAGGNVGLAFCKQFKTGNTFQHCFITNKIMESSFVSNKTGEITYSAPLYLYHEDGTKIPNLDKEIWSKIDDVAGETKPEDILDYIYAVLHSPKYREKYKEFLKIDFPRVPYPENKDKFWKLVKLGHELRGLHLLESSKVNDFMTTFPEGGSNIAEKGYPKFISAGIRKMGSNTPVETGNVFIGEGQYFGNVPKIAWEFYIGGYQPAQKWLKDRRERELSNEDIDHYQKIIVSLSETDRIMKEIDEI